jgi:4-amino-4-deoxy-L-arabinose transferase-like glycosyltransferase
LNHPTPAIVTERAAQRLPRWGLLLLCAAYVLPGQLGRDPWRNADVSAYGYMHHLAMGWSDLWHPMVAGIPSDGGLFPYWLGALFIGLLGGVMDPALAARIPFALLLAAVLALTWYATYHLARTDAAQPVAFAFGGEAKPIDYARSVADGALLALIATLGLLQLGHETTPELLQLASMALAVYALAASQTRTLKPVLAQVIALPLMAGSGAPTIALGLGAVGLGVCWRSSYEQTRHMARWIAVSMLLAALVATLFGAWGWRARGEFDLVQLLRLLVWFTWPAWPLAGWTLWRWRHHLKHRHIAVPMATAGVGLAACVLQGGSDRALMLALPSLAVLSAFALPTLRRGVASAVDWFSVFFFSACAIAIWVIYAAMHTGTPARTAANIVKLAPGFEPRFSLLALLVAVAGTLGWLALVRWRAGRHRDALWRSLVLAASGVALSWLLLMTLWLPLLNYARSDRPLVERLARHLDVQACVQASGLPRSQLAALETLGGFKAVVAPPASAACPLLLMPGPVTEPEAPQGWIPVARERRPTDRTSFTYVYRRADAGGPAAQ